MCPINKKNILLTQRKKYNFQKIKLTCAGYSTGAWDTKINETCLPALEKFRYDNIAI